ncbi:hypothetical protein [Streptomyces sp. NBC_01304]|uniref:hypothetical protein n=1 Tax=Streptomyces sp. NBC_01304 TaxID=2903818 RepID=UPI002E11F27A|nr:hypothetical protein OG430_41320 [Streptomyces sp. NBC_01304]
MRKIEIEIDERTLDTFRRLSRAGYGSVEELTQRAVANFAVKFGALALQMTSEDCDQ